MSTDTSGTDLSCPCCGTSMESSKLGSKVLHRCPSCGVTDLRIEE